MDRPTFFRLAVPLATLAAALPAQAHPGDHGRDWAASIAHLLTEPDHLALIALAAVVGALAWRRIARRGGNGR